ncbi:MAG: hypothetical protein SFX74_02090 [Fimbriimonadaceae bacterium]|nr:hypothetical protein [Fimbriimonadaceae bacterium]
MALEMHKPLAGIAGAGSVVFAPFLVPFFGFDSVNDYTRVLARRENIERLMEILEARRTEDPTSAPEAKA